MTQIKRPAPDPEWAIFNHGLRRFRPHFHADLWRMRAIPFVGAALCALALSGCSAQGNEGACKDFESAYNSGGLRYEPGTVGGSGIDYGTALKKLSDAAKAGTTKASGDVEKHLQEIVDEQTMYSSAISSQNSLASTRLVRTMVDNSRDGLFKACEAAGVSIRLGPVNPGQ